MACMKLGSKSEAFHRDGQQWFSSTGLPSDVIVEVGEMSFHLHKFPLLSRSGVLEKLIEEYSYDHQYKCLLQLHDVPGGAKTFLLVAKFCYGVKIELSAGNIVGLRCAAEYLKMSEEYEEGNLIKVTEDFLTEIYGNWLDSIKVLQSCEEFLPYAEELHIVSRCVDSLASKVCTDQSLFSWPMSQCVPMDCREVSWNGICSTARSQPLRVDWWYEDVSVLRLPLYKRFILAVESRSIKPGRISGSLAHYAKTHLPLMGRDSSSNLHSASYISTDSSDTHQKDLLEEIVGLLPNQDGATPVKFLLRLLRTSMVLHGSVSCQENLEKRIGAQLDEATLSDLLIPNVGCATETLYDTDCVQRILHQFVIVDHETNPFSSHYMDDEGQLLSNYSVSPMTKVANLVDQYLAEVAPDVNLKLQKFQSLAAVIPDYARPSHDGIYRAIDIYLKAHPWVTEMDRGQLCQLINCQKLSLEASTHAAQNERLPLRMIVQVLFFEQIRLRTSVSGLVLVSDNLGSLQNPTENLAITRNELSTSTETVPLEHAAVDDMMERVSQLEKECYSMKQELEKLVKTKRTSWNMFKLFGFKSKSTDSNSFNPCNVKLETKAAVPLLKGEEHQISEQGMVPILGSN